jgi:hypothetical protein
VPTPTATAVPPTATPADTDTPTATETDTPTDTPTATTTTVSSGGGGGGGSGGGNSGGGVTSVVGIVLLVTGIVLMLLIVVGVVAYLVMSGRRGPGPEAAGGQGAGPDGPAPWPGGATGYGRSLPGANTGYDRAAPGGFGRAPQYGGVANWDDTTVPSADWKPKPMSGNRRGAPAPDEWSTPAGLPNLDAPDEPSPYGQPPAWRPQTPPGAQPSEESSWTRTAQSESWDPTGPGWGQPGSGRANPSGGEHPARNPWNPDAPAGDGD